MEDKSTRSKNRREVWAYGLFWSWNLIFLAFMTLGFAPTALPDLIAEVRTGLIPIQYLLFALVLAAIPAIAVILGLTVLRRSPGKLFSMGYVVEGPLMLLLAVRFFLIRQANPGITLIMAVALLGMAAFMWQLLDPKIDARGSLARWLRLIGLSFMALTSLYAALWIAFYAVPLAAYAINQLAIILADLPQASRNFLEFLRNIFSQELAWIPFMILGLILLFYTSTLFVLTPIAVPFLSLRAWWRSLTGQVDRHGWLAPAALVALLLVVSLGLFALTDLQPQQRAFDMLAEAPASPDQAIALIDQEESIRAGLLNAYLAPFRYISSQGEVRHVSQIYEDVFKISPESAFRVQRLYESVARPLLYDPVHQQDIVHSGNNRALQQEPREAAQLYQRFFDQTIEEGERESIVRAVRSTWSASQAEAAWLAVDHREIHLLQQEVAVEEHGDWAEVEIYEVYQNQTAENQEVVYYFSLPESAVVTGVWLGDSPDRAERFEYRVAPRGAAQESFKSELVRRIDPALLEQIGPRQYRLRVFPVLPMTFRFEGEDSRQVFEDAPPLYLWFNYKVFIAEDAWPLPRLAERRNVYWDDNTVRIVNGIAKQADEDEWLPQAIPASQPAAMAAHRADLPGGFTVQALPAAQAGLPGLPDGLRLAVVLDRSRSMADHADEVAAALSRLEELPELAAPADVYLTASPYRGEEPSLVSLDAVDPANLLYFGGQNAGELLAQFNDLSANRSYDAVLVLTDGSGYELGEGPADLRVPAAPVWLVHLGDEIPLGYDDHTLEAIQASGGGLAGDLGEALDRLAPALSSEQSRTPDDPVYIDVIDGYVWSLKPTEQAQELGEIPAENAFLPFAARHLILAEIHRQRSNLEDLQLLDRLHALAQEYSIVTPYSSMIVLVTAAQQARLDTLEEGSDRFEREYDPVGETTPPGPLATAGVPEPHEWLLLGLGVAFLLWLAYSRSNAVQRIAMR
jgi:putative PEP-CTERM system integral membrane protein